MKAILAKHAAVALLLVGCSLPAVAIDVTSQTTIVRGAILLNRATSTYDATVTITNLGQQVLIAPKLVVATDNAQVVLTAPTGTLPVARPYVLLPLPADTLVLVRGQPITVILKFANPGRVAFATTLTVEAALPPANLPPDPGSAGELTLLGIDSDNDGVRDDVQRYIEFTYPNSQRVRLALREIAKTYQLWYTVQDLSVYNVRSILDKAMRNLACLYSIVGVNEGVKQSQLLFAEFTNNLDRYRARAKVERVLAGQAFDLPQVSNIVCAFHVNGTAN